MGKIHRVILSFLLVGVIAAASLPAAPDAGALPLRARTLERIPGTADEWSVVNKNLEWDPHQTAVVVCDMWNQHWCKGATARVAEMAPRMNQVIAVARQQGMLIVHAPRDCMDYYK